MSDSDHPIVSYFKSYAETEDDSALTDKLVNELISYDPAARITALGQFKASIAGEYEGKTPSLRQEAQMLNVTRALENTHIAMRKAGR